MIEFLIHWILFYVSIMIAMCVDNIFWIPTSPEYPNFKENKMPIFVEGKLYHSRLSYIFKYRILSVLTHWRDIVPAIISSTILTLLW